MNCVESTKNGRKESSCAFLLMDIYWRTLCPSPNFLPVLSIMTKLNIKKFRYHDKLWSRYEATQNSEDLQTFHRRSPTLSLLFITQLSYFHLIVHPTDLELWYFNIELMRVKLLLEILQTLWTIKPISYIFPIISTRIKNDLQNVNAESRYSRMNFVGHKHLFLH